MYHIERYLCTLKSYVRNRSRPEGSIVEGYNAEECLAFCSLYFAEGVETRFNRVNRNDDGVSVENIKLDVFSNSGRPLGKGEAGPLDNDREHCEIVKNEYPHLSKHQIERIHGEQFASWFAEKYFQDEDHVSYDMKLLASGLNPIGIYYKTILVNAFRFHTKELESKRKTQNSGVIVSATTSSFLSTKDQNPILGEVAYYGVLKNIIELDYVFDQKVILFDCDWVSQGNRVKQDEDGFTMVNLSNPRTHNEPFILSSQAKQVFYGTGWSTGLLR